MSWIWMIISLSCLLLHAAVREVEGKEGFGPGEQDWGYVTVRPSAHMFWWLYYVNPSIRCDNFSVDTRPLLIWLQGGPGASSTAYGNFEEFGPLDINLEKRNHTWVNDYNVLFIDNPVGSGFSYVDSLSELARDNRQIAKDLIECIRGFYDAIPLFKNVPVYIIAESYGGKMAAEFALLWFQAQENGEINSNLKGVILSEPWISPIDSILSWAPYLFHTGMVDSEGFKKIQNAALDVKKAVNNELWIEASYFWENTGNVIIELTKNIDFYNILEKTSMLRDNNYCLQNLMNTQVKCALGLNQTCKIESLDVFEKLRSDFMKPVTYIVERLLNETNLKVVVLAAQLDLIVATPGTLAWVENLKWENIEAWKKSDRIALYVDDIIEGYVKTYENFKMYWINRSGHMIPRDNPNAMNKVLYDLTSTTFLQKLIDLDLYPEFSIEISW